MLLLLQQLKAHIWYLSAEHALRGNTQPIVILRMPPEQTRGTSATRSTVAHTYVAAVRQCCRRKNKKEPPEHAVQYMHTYCGKVLLLREQHHLPRTCAAGIDTHCDAVLLLQQQQHLRRACTTGVDTYCDHSTGAPTTTRHLRKTCTCRTAHTFSQ